MESIRKFFSTAAVFIAGLIGTGNWGVPLPESVLFAAKRNCNYADQRVGLVGRADRCRHSRNRATVRATCFYRFNICRSLFFHRG